MPTTYSAQLTQIQEYIASLIQAIERPAGDFKSKPRMPPMLVGPRCQNLVGGVRVPGVPAKVLADTLKVIQKELGKITTNISKAGL